MSNSVNDDLTRVFVLGNYMYFAATALCCYDYCLTLGDEIRYVWKKRRGVSTLLFCGIRYPAIVNTAFVILGLHNWPSWQSNYSCMVLVRMEMVLNIILLASAAGFASLRVYAIFGKNRVVFLVVLVLALINPAISIYCFTLVTGMIGARASSLLADGLVLVLTWFKLPNTDSNLNVARRSRSLTSVLVMDTGIYFMILCVVNAVGIGIGHFIELVISLSTWIAILTSILMARLVIDLHKSNAQHASVDDCDNTVLFHVAQDPGFSMDTLVEGMNFDDEMGMLGT